MLIKNRFYDYREVRVLDCCKANTKSITIMLTFPESREEEAILWDSPKWSAARLSTATEYVGFQYETDFLNPITKTKKNSDGTEYESTKYPEIKIWDDIVVKSCPFCGTEVPEIKAVEASGDVYSGSGYDYCLTCDERCMSCKCRSPAAKWAADWPEGHEMIENC